jgi:hypothetical protein
VATSRSGLRRQAEPTNRTERSGGSLNGGHNSGSLRQLPRAPACRFSQRFIGLGDGGGSRSGDRPWADPGDSHPPRLSSTSQPSVRQQCRGESGRNRRAGRGGVTSRV